MLFSQFKIGLENKVLNLNNVHFHFLFSNPLWSPDLNQMIHYVCSEIEVDWYGFFSGRCRYLEIRADDGRYMMPILLGRYVWPILFFFINLINLFLANKGNLLLKLKHVRNVVWSFLKIQFS